MVCLYRNTEKTGALYTLKLVYLLQKYGKNGYVVYIKISIVKVEKTELLYIVKLVCHWWRFQEEIALVRRVDEDPFGVFRGYPVAYIPYTPPYTEKCKPCLLCGMFGARSSSGPDHNISRKECVTLVDAWGTCGSRERCLGW